MSVNRRDFLIDGLRLGALLPAWTWTRAPRAQGERVLVVVQLGGGNDGLNTVVPHRQDAYARGRPTLALPRAGLHALDDDHGLHPSLSGLGELFAEGRLTVIQGVGYPEPNRSHFRSMEIWHTADPLHPPAGVGWLGRLADQIVRTQPGAMPGLHVGDEDLPLALMGESYFAPSVRDEQGLRLRQLPGLDEARATRLGARAASGELAFLRTAAASAYRAAERMERAATSRPAVDYPDLALARKLRLVAQLVRGGFDARLFLVTLGGFDTHARQAAFHAALLDELSRSLTAFQRDLEHDGAARRVATLVFSEFGRRTAENASRGTDHGAAAPVFLLGGPGPGGLLGTAPDLEHLVDGDVPHTTDFRALYAALEHGWMGLAPSTDVPALPL